MKEKNILNVTDKELKENVELVFRVFRDEKETYDKVQEILNELALNGLWRGHDAAFKIIYNLIKEKGALK